MLADVRGSRRGAAAVAGATALLSAAGVVMVMQIGVGDAVLAAAPRPVPCYAPSRPSSWLAPPLISFAAVVTTSRPGHRLPAWRRILLIAAGLVGISLGSLCALAPRQLPPALIDAAAVGGAATAIGVLLLGWRPPPPQLRWA